MKYNDYSYKCNTSSRRAKNKGAQKAPLFTTYSTNTLTERLAEAGPFLVDIDMGVNKEENSHQVTCTSSRIRSVESALTVECWWPFSFLKRFPQQQSITFPAHLSIVLFEVVGGNVVIKITTAS